MAQKKLKSSGIGIFIGLFVVGFIFTGCSDNTFSTESDNNITTTNQERAKAGSTGKYSDDPVVRKAEEPFFELSDRMPGFAGYHLDREGNLITLVKGGQNPETVRQEVSSYVNNRYQRSNMEFSAGGITVKNTDYSFRELSNWRDVLIGPAFDVDGVTMFDLTEDKNRLTIGIESEAIKERLEDKIAEFDVPREAINIKITGKIESLAGVSSDLSKRVIETPVGNHMMLDDKFRPLTGGIQLDVETSSSGTFPCTYGVMGVWQTKNVFITASHCTEDPWEPETGTNYYQPTTYSSNVIGEEVHDPSGFYGDGDCGGWFSNPECRYSDAALIEFKGSVTGEMGRIAKTEGRGVGWTPGSRTIDDNLPRFRIISDDKDILVNMPLNKMGSVSGWTNGWVDGTCVTIDWDNKSNSEILCQTVVNQMLASSGDSGSPVFYDHTTDYGDIELIGILWGRSIPAEQSFVSPMNNVYEDLGNMLTTDPPLSVSISGLSFIEETGIYNWDASTQNQDGPVSYQWSIRWEGTSTWTNLGTSSSQTVSVNDDTDFTLRVEATDNLDQVTVPHSVTVNLDGCSPGNPCDN